MLKSKVVMALFTAVLFISAAYSQTDDASDQSASTDGAAESAAPVKATQQFMIEEVYVTTSKRTESVQDVSAAVSAFSDATLKNANISDFNQLADVTPGLVSRDSSEGNNLTIRGVGKAFGGTSPVAFHVNGYFVDTTESFYDVSTLEIIRGPSGTVYGRNATAGAIDVKWQRPTDEWDVGGDFLGGSFDQRRLRAFANVPLLEYGDRQLNSRFAAVWEKRNGHLYNEFAQDDDEQPNSKTEYFYRVMLEGFVSDNLRVGVHAIKQNLKMHAGTVASPSLSTRAGERYEDFGVATMPADLLVVRSQQYQEQGPGFRRTSRVVTDMTWNMEGLWFLGDVDLDFAIGADRRREFRYTDLDGSEQKIVETASQINGIGRNAELRLTSQNGDGFDWILGFFWYRDDNHDTLHVDARTKDSISEFSPENFGLLPFDIPSESDQVFDAKVDYIDQNNNTKNEAIFFNMRFQLQEMFANFPDVEVFTGLRKNTDNYRLKTARELVTATCSYDGCDAGGYTATDKSSDAPGESTATTGEAGAKWFYTDDGMIYLKYATGYKPGTAQVQRNAPLNVVDPEFLKMIEFGWKTSLFDNRSLILNVTAFDYSYIDLQVSKIVVTGIKLENAGAASIRGVEAELQWAPSAEFYALLTFGWLDAKFEQFCGRDDELVEQAVQPGCTEEDAPHNFEGATMSDSPEFSFGALLRYTFDFGSFGSLTPSVKYSWSDDYQRRAYDNPIDNVPAHHKTNVRLSWQSPERRFKIEAFVENIEDHDEIFTHHFSMPDPGNYSLLAPQAPRTSGVSFEARL